MTAPIPSPVDTAPAEQAVPPAPVPTPPPAVPPAPAPPVDPAPVVGEPVDTPEIAKVRKEAANYRTKLREQETAAATLAQERDAQAAETAGLKDMLAKLAAVLNPGADQPVDPEVLAKQLADEKAQREQERATLTEQHAAQIRALTVQATLPAVLAKAGANPDLTTAVLTSDGTLAKLDPSAATFAADLESAVNAALDAHPALKVAPVVARSGAEIPGRSGGSDQLSLEQVKGMKPDEIDAARKAGRLKSLGIG